MVILHTCTSRLYALFQISWFRTYYHCHSYNSDVPMGEGVSQVVAIVQGGHSALLWIFHWWWGKTWEKFFLIPLNTFITIVKYSFQINIHIFEVRADSLNQHCGFFLGGLDQEYCKRQRCAHHFLLHPSDPPGQGSPLWLALRDPRRGPQDPEPWCSSHPGV